MRYAARIMLAAALCGCAAGAHAREATVRQSVWQGCGDNPVSGVSKFMVGPTAARALNPKVLPATGIERCTAALDLLDVSGPWQRRAALLRSRAKFQLAAKQHKAGLADLDAIAAIEQPDPVYDRSFGVSLRMLRAIAYLEAGRRTDAADAGFDAMRRRPWSKRVASFAYTIASLRDVIPRGEAGRWDRHLQLDEAFAEKRATLLARAGEWSAAAADWLHATPAPGESGQYFVTVPNIRVSGAPGVPISGVDIARTGEAAITAAMAGRSDLATEWIARARQNLARPAQPDWLSKQLDIATDPAARGTELDRWAALADIAALASKGDVDAAAAKIKALENFPVSLTVLAMLTDIAARVPTGSHQRLATMLDSVTQQYQLDRNERYLQAFDPDSLLDEIPDHEEVMLANPYRSTVKFLKANGYSSKVAKDGKTAEIAFFGSKSKPFAIGEMALLRAAELTESLGKRGFLITDGNDYVHTSTMTMYGTPIGPTTVSGYSTKLKISFADVGADPAGAPASKVDSSRLILAADVRSALGPIYAPVTADIKD